MSNADEINPVTVKDKIPQTRLERIVPRIHGDNSRYNNRDCWHCGAPQRHKLIWCYRCYFYVQNNFNDLEP